MRNILSYVTNRDQSMVAAMVRTVFAQQDHAQARAQWRTVPIGSGVVPQGR